MFWPFANTWRFRSIFNKGLKRRLNSLRRRSWLFGSGITIEATDRDDGRFSCQLEQLEPKKVLDADFNLVGTTLTITLDDDNQAITFTPTSTVGNYTFLLSGASSDNFIGSNATGVTGSGNTLTIQSGALVDDIVVTTNASITSGSFTFASAGGSETVDNLTVDVDGQVLVNTNATFSGSASLDITGGSLVSVSPSATFTVTSTGGHLNITPEIQTTANPVLRADTISVGKINTFNQGISFVGDTTVGVVSQGGVVSVTGDLNVTGQFGGTSLSVSGDTTVSTSGIQTSSTQTYSGNFTLNHASVLLTASGAVSFAGSVIGGGHSLEFFFGSGGSTALDGSAITGLNSLVVTTLSGAGSVTLTGPITTTTTQTYSVPTISLVGDTTLNATTATFSTDTSVAGNGHNLTVNGAFSTIGFAGLQNLNVTGTTSARNTISTSGTQTYGGTVSLTGDTALTGATLSHTGFSGGGARDLTLSFTDRVELDGSKFVGISDFVTNGAGGVNLSGTFSTVRTQTFGGGGVSLVGDATLKTTTGGSGGRIVFTAPTIDGTHNLTLTRDSGIADYFDIQSTIGATAQLASLSVSGANDVYLHQNVSTAGTQTYGASRSLFLQKSGALNLTASEVVISSPVQGYTAAPDVTIAGNLDLSGAFTSGIGSGVRVNTLTVTGTAEFNADILTVAGQTYEGAVTITGGNPTLGTTSGDVVFNGTVDGGSQTVTVSSGLDLNADASNLASLSVSRAADLGGNVTTSGAQTYDTAVTLSGGDRSLTSSGGSTIQFKSTLTGSGDDLTVDGGFKALGSVTSIGNLAVSGASTIEASVTTSGTQTYNGTVTVQNGTRTFTGTTVQFANTATALTGDSNGVVVTGNLDLDGSASSLLSLSVSGDSNLGGNVSASSSQTYTGAVTLSGGSRQLTATSVVFGSTVDGGNAGLTVSGSVDINAPVTNLTTLSVTGASDLGGNVTSTGNQVYTGAVTLSGGDRNLNVGTGTASFGSTGVR